jgi:hypothetical protein
MQPDFSEFTYGFACMYELVNACSLRKVPIFPTLHEDIALFFEATGTIEDEPVSTRPGLERTDTVKKIIATAFLTLKATGNPIIVLTSHSPDPELSSGKMLNMAGRDVILDVINVNIENDINRLKGYLNFNCNNLDSIVRQNKSLFE